jgi:phenolic acid decarboxylase
MKCTPEFENRVRKIIGKGVLAVTISCFAAGIMYVTYTDPMVFVTMVSAFSIIYGIIFFAMWCNGDINFCKRPDEDYDDYDDML